MKKELKLKKQIALVQLIILTLAVSACASNYPSSENNTSTTAYNNYNPLVTENNYPDISTEIGEIIRFGGNDWRVLDIQNNSALIISEKSLMKRDYIGISWENSWLRQYLNGSFYIRNFSEEEKSRIMESVIVNDDVIGRIDDNDTVDKVFLLSVKEVVYYFGDSGILNDSLMSDRIFHIDDQYNSARVLKDKDNRAVWWWLRHNSIFPAGNTEAGHIYLYGGSICDFVGGIRPAMWIDLTQ